MMTLGYRDMDFICRVLVMADQLLIERLKQLCELSLAGMSKYFFHYHI